MLALEADTRQFKAWLCHCLSQGKSRKSVFTLFMYEKAEVEIPTLQLTAETVDVPKALPVGGSD